MISIMAILSKKQFVHNRILRKYLMKRYMFGILLVFALIICSFQLAGADNFRPTWKIGDRWLVKAVYLSHMDKEKWSGPVFWEYEVIGIEGEDQKRCYILEIRDRDGRLNLNTRLEYRDKDLSLTKAKITKIRGGKELVRNLAFKGGIPVITEQTLTPYDSPVFPLMYQPSAEFSFKRQIGDLEAVEVLRQDMREVSTVDGIQVKPSCSELIEVKCIGKDGIVFIQYWDRAYPWPIYGRNVNMKYWVVKE